MTAYIFCLRYVDADNWRICKERRLIGVRTSPSGMNSAREVRLGDTIYVWRGGAGRAGAGLLAQVTATGPATPAVNAPWPESESYTFVIPFQLNEELTEPIPDGFPGNARGTRFKFMNSDLQKSLRPLSDVSAKLLAECFGSDDVLQRGEPETIAIPGGGWSSNQDLIRRVEEAAVAAVRRHLAHEGWREVRDCQKDGCGYDLLCEHADGRRRLVEIKGTTGSAMRFRLTRLEREVLSRDPDGRIYVVLDALVTPKVEVLNWAEVEDLGVRAASWQVG